MPRLSEVALAVASFAAVAGCAELALRWQRSQLLERFGARAPCTQAAEDPALVYTYAPGHCGANSAGFPDVERSLDKPAGSLRIALIGDSVAAGDGVAREEAFGPLLERALNASRREPVEVLVLARTGYSTSQQLVVLDEAFRYEPDLVLWSYVLNDPAHPIYHIANRELGRYYAPGPLQLGYFLRSQLFRLRDIWASRGCPSEFHARIHCAYWPEVVSALDELARRAAREQTPIALVIHPVFEEGRDFATYSLADLHARLAREARARGLAVLDLLDTYRPYPPDALKQHRPDLYDPWHPSPRGHALAARAIERFLGSEGLLPRPEG